MKTLLIMGAFILAHSVLAEDLTRGIYPKAIQSRARGNIPVAVFDLDETLVNSTPRRYLALQSALPALAAQFPAEVEKLRSVRLEHLLSLQNRYSITELLAKAGIQNAQFQSQLDAQFVPHYLSSEYIAFDRDIACGAKFIRDLVKMGVVPVYISSRYARTQMAGTVANLQELQITRPNETYRIILRPDGMSSIDFKKMAFAKVKSLGSELGKPVDIVLAVENEPENMNAMTAEFPEAYRFFVKGAFLKDEPLQFPAHAKSRGPFLIQNYCP